MYQYCPPPPTYTYVYTCVSWDEVQRVEVGEVVATVHLNGFQEPHHHPGPDENQVVAQQQDANEKPGP